MDEVGAGLGRARPRGRGADCGAGRAAERHHQRDAGSRSRPADCRARSMAPLYRGPPSAPTTAKRCRNRQRDACLRVTDVDKLGAAARIVRAGSGQVERSLADHRRDQTVRGAAGPGAHFPGLRGARRGVPSCGSGGRGGEALPRGARSPPRVRARPGSSSPRRSSRAGTSGRPGRRSSGSSAGEPDHEPALRIAVECALRGGDPSEALDYVAASGRAGSARPRRAGTVPGARRRA